MTSPCRYLLGISLLFVSRCAVSRKGGESIPFSKCLTSRSVVALERYTYSQLPITFCTVLIPLAQSSVASATKSLHQDRSPCYLQLPIFSYTYTLFFCWKIKSFCDRSFLQLFFRCEIFLIQLIAKCFC